MTGKIIIVIDDKTIARLECGPKLVYRMFHEMRLLRLDWDYIVAMESDYVVGVADKMVEDAWYPTGANPLNYNQETLDRFPELRGKW